MEYSAQMNKGYLCSIFIISKNGNNEMLINRELVKQIIYRLYMISTKG